MVELEKSQCMEIEVVNTGVNNIAIVKETQEIIRETQDAIDLLADAGYYDCRKIIIREENLTPGFFDLKSGIAGDILQKFSTYGVKLAIIGDFSKYKSKSLQDFIYESNKYGRINFVNTFEEAKVKLDK
jgi:hypothetical protein